MESRSSKPIALQIHSYYMALLASADINYLVSFTFLLLLLKGIQLFDRISSALYLYFLSMLISCHL